MRKWAAYLLCFLSLALLGISGHFLADYAKQEEKADILQEQLKKFMKTKKKKQKRSPDRMKKSRTSSMRGFLPFMKKTRIVSAG